MRSTEDVVHELSDSQVVEVVKELFNDVYTQVPYETVRKNSETVGRLHSLATVDQEVLQQELSATESVRLGRLVLEQYARDPELSPAVEKAWEKVRSSDNLVVGVILTLGLIVNLTLLVATTAVHVKKGADGKIVWKVTKKQADENLLKAIIDPVVEAVKFIKL